MTQIFFVLGIAAGIACLFLSLPNSWPVTPATAGTACGMGIAAGLCMIAAAINNAITTAAESLGREIRHRAMQPEGPTK